MMTLRVHFDGKVLVPDGPVDLPVGQAFEVELREARDLPKGSPALLLRIMRDPPHVSPDIVQEFERAIEEGKRSVRYDGPFDDMGK